MHFAKDLQKLLISHFGKVEKFGQNSSGGQSWRWWWCCKGSSQYRVVAGWWAQLLRSFQSEGEAALVLDTNSLSRGDGDIAKYWKSPKIFLMMTWEVVHCSQPPADTRCAVDFLLRSLVWEEPCLRVSNGYKFCHLALRCNPLYTRPASQQMQKSFFLKVKI